MGDHRARAVAPDLSVFEEVGGRPIPEVIIEKGERVCSIVTGGANRNSSLGKARAISEPILESLQQRR